MRSTGNRVFSHAGHGRGDVEGIFLQHGKVHEGRRRCSGESGRCLVWPHDACVWMGEGGKEDQVSDRCETVKLKTWGRLFDKQELRNGGIGRY